MKYRGYDVVTWPKGAENFEYDGVDLDCRDDTIYFVEPDGPFIMSPSACEDLAVIINAEPA